MQGRLLAVEHVDETFPIDDGPSPEIGKPPPHALQGVHDVLARAQRVGAEVGTRAVGLTPFDAPQRHAVGLARRGAGDDVVRPRGLGIAGLQAKFLRSRPLRRDRSGLVRRGPLR